MIIYSLSFKRPWWIHVGYWHVEPSSAILHALQFFSTSKMHSVVGDIQTELTLEVINFLTLSSYPLERFRTLSTSPLLLNVRAFSTFFLCPMKDKKAKALKVFLAIHFLKSRSQDKMITNQHLQTSFTKNAINRCLFGIAIV